MPLWDCSWKSGLIGYPTQHSPKCAHLSRLSPILGLEGIGTISSGPLEAFSGHAPVGPQDREGSCYCGTSPRGCLRGDWRPQANMVRRKGSPPPFVGWDLMARQLELDGPPGGLGPFPWPGGSMKTQRGCLPVEIQKPPSSPTLASSLSHTSRLCCVAFLCEEGGRSL